MLASLLPGLRDVRAPLAAGYLWLVACWLTLEPSVPERADAHGVVASLYRADDVLSVVGLGLVLAFAAYLLGSLSAGASGRTLSGPTAAGRRPVAGRLQQRRARPR